MIEFLAVLHIKGFDYRSLEGIMRALAKRIAPFPVISYSQICRRVNSLKIDFGTVEQNLIVAGDASGEKVSNRGKWMRHKWNVRRGWIKVVILGTPDGKVIDVRLGLRVLMACMTEGYVQFM